MRTRSILMLASVAMILMATGIGNAFATTTYFSSGGYALQSQDNGVSASWSATYPETLTVPHTNSQGWGNSYCDASSVADTAYLNYMTSPYSGELSLNTYPVSVPVYSTQSATFSGSLGGHTGTQITISANHAFYSYGGRSTSYNTGLKFTES